MLYKTFWQRSSLKSVFSVILGLALSISPIFSLGNLSAGLGSGYIVQAAGVQLYADLTADAGNPRTPATLTTQPIVQDNTATEVNFSYVATSSFGLGDEVTFSFPAAVSIANTCSAPTTDADNDGVGDGSGVISGQQYTYTFTNVAATAVEFCVELTTPLATTASYNVQLTSTNDNDFGAALVYAYDAAGPSYPNRVELTAVVAPILQLTITDTTDNPTSNCDLGVLDTVSVSQCQYRIYAGSTQTTGTATLSFLDITNTITGNLTGLSKGSVVDADDIDPTSTNTDVTAGIEGVGVTYTPDGTTFALQGNYNDGTNPGDDPVPAANTQLATAAGFIDGTVDGADFLLATHSAAADAGTQSGTYTQWVEYRLVSAP